MDRIYTALIQFITLLASFFSIFAFFKTKAKARLIWLISGVVVAVGLSAYSIVFNENRIDTIRRTYLVNDAKVLDSSIIISGWENEGAYLGYLIQLRDFYSRHKDYYADDAALYTQYVSEWSEFFRRKRLADSYVTSSQTAVLEGLVKAGKSNIQSIIENNRR